jgi:hypothetical protein
MLFKENKVLSRKIIIAIPAAKTPATALQTHGWTPPKRRGRIIIGISTRNI